MAETASGPVPSGLAVGLRGYVCWYVYAARITKTNAARAANAQLLEAAAAISIHENASFAVLGKHLPGRIESYENVARSMEGMYSSMNKPMWSFLAGIPGEHGSLAHDANMRMIDMNSSNKKPVVFTHKPLDADLQSSLNM